MDNIKKIKELLISLGVTPNSKGFFYLAVAINDAFNVYKAGKIDIDFMLTYKAISFMYDDTVSRVERAMRHAVYSAFKKPNAMLKSIFTFLQDLDNSTEKVSISCFVCALAQYLYYEE